MYVIEVCGHRIWQTAQISADNADGLFVTRTGAVGTVPHSDRPTRTVRPILKTIIKLILG